MINFYKQSLSNDYQKDIEKIKEAFKDKELTFFIGNGLSRLYEGCPSWKKLFLNPEFIKKYINEGIDYNNALKKEYFKPLASALNGYNRQTLYADLTNWTNRITENNLCLPHKILSEVSSAWNNENKSNPMKCLTTNIDSVLDRVFGERNVTHLHGNTESNMVISEEDYRQASKNPHVIYHQSKVIIFLGYGFHYQDNDVEDWLHTIKEKNAQHRKDQKTANDLITLYSVMPFEETIGLSKERLDKLGVKPIGYKLPTDATKKERETSISCALRDIFSDHLSDDVKQEIEKLNTSVYDIRNNPILVIGLASLNTILENEETDTNRQFPIVKRSSLKTKYHREPGGPGLIAAGLMASLKCPVFIAASICNDTTGNLIKKYLYNWRQNGKEHLFTDLLLCKEPNSKKRLHTWESVILVDNHKSGQRVFLDNEANVNLMGYDGKKYKEITTQDIFFDRFNRNNISNILGHFLDSGNKDYENVWSYYETGERGDLRDGYGFENTTILKKVNLAICSFQFAFAFLVMFVGKNVDFCETEIENICNSKKNISELSDAEQIELIQHIIKSKRLSNDFIKNLALGGHQWLRNIGEMRAIVVTLHKIGCIYLRIDNKGKIVEHGIIDNTDNTDNEKIICTTSAGDTFRTAFVSYVYRERQKGNFNIATLLRKASKFANKAAGIKCKFFTVQEAHTKIKELFDEDES